MERRAGGYPRWDLVERAVLPVLYSQAGAVLLGALLPRGPAPALLTAFLAALALALTLFYHNLRVRTAGKGVLVTGCQSPVGSGVVRSLDTLGFTVYACFPELGEESEALKNQCSGRVRPLELDLASEESIQRAKHSIPSTGIWAVVHAACWPAFGEVEWIPISSFRKSVDLNIIAPIRLTQVLLPLLRKNKGRVVVVSGVEGLVHKEVRSPLCLARAALNAWARCLRQELAPAGVDVVTIHSGHLPTCSWFETKGMQQEAREMWQYMSEDVRKDYGQDYFEYKIRTMKEYTSNMESDVSSVVRCISEGASRTFPLREYWALTWQERLEVAVAHHLPLSVYQVLYR